MNTLTILRRVKDRLQEPSRWTKMVMAIDSNGSPVGSRNPHAVRWCLVGAACKETNDNSGLYHPSMGFLRKAMRLLYGSGPDGLSDFNDTHEHSDVMRVVDKAIELAERGDKE